KDLTLENGCADGNKGYMKDGGAIYMKGAILTLDRVTFINNEAYNVSGALDTKDSLITITDSTFSGNSAGGGAGAIGNGTGSTMIITGSIFSGNSAGAILGYGGGGAIGDYGDLTISDSTISGNKDLSGANGIGGGGIGVINGGTLQVTGSTISGNSSNAGQGGGGGIGLAFASATVTNSTVAGNSASGDFGGGGILALSASLKLVFSTVAGNSTTGAAGGGGVGVQKFIGGPAPTFAAKDSLVADNTSGGDCDASAGATFTSSGINIDSDGSCGALDSTFSQHSPAELALGSLANNGGATKTIALFPQSVAVDAAADCTDLGASPVTTDQRGVARPQDGNGDGTAVCDLGAYEAVPSVVQIPTLDLQSLALLGLLLAAGALAFLRRG
ncbi:MAG TPA: choice-of-anchor Q domain-containing protein, partial [Thermoanaerobaculia bacterium]|nr:choice-of-anchor Q domain-containing protein [Thermoanaerobaculia bacterium]